MNQGTPPSTPFNAKSFYPQNSIKKFNCSKWGFTHQHFACSFGGLVWEKAVQCCPASYPNKATFGSLPHKYEE